MVIALWATVIVLGGRRHNIGNGNHESNNNIKKGDEKRGSEILSFFVCESVSKKVSNADGSNSFIPGSPPSFVSEGGCGRM